MTCDKETLLIPFGIFYNVETTLVAERLQKTQAMQRIYLDWNATAPLLPEVRDALISALERYPGNASSIHREGQTARSVIERCRRAVARAVGAPAQAVVLTGGATEGNNQVLRTHVRYTQGAHIVCSAVEHPSVLEVVESLAQQGVKTTIIGVDRAGRLDYAALERALDDGATLVSVMWANNENGNVYDVERIASMVHAAGALYHTDATQALGRLGIDFRAVGADYMTLSAHKMGGPKGIGAVVVREGLVLEAMLSGGHQERGRRPGTENVPAAAGLEAAAKLIVTERPAWTERLLGAREALLSALNEHAPGFQVRCDPENYLPNTLNVAFDGVGGEDLLLALDLAGVSASSGSACTAGSLEPSHVILAMGYEPGEAKRSVRFSWGITTPARDVTHAAQRVGEVVGRLRALGVAGG